VNRKLLSARIDKAPVPTQALLTQTHAIDSSRAGAWWDFLSRGIRAQGMDMIAVLWAQPWNPAGIHASQCVSAAPTLQIL